MALRGSPQPPHCALPLPCLTAPIQALFLRPMIEIFFAYRLEVLARVLD